MIQVLAIRNDIPHTTRVRTHIVHPVKNITLSISLSGKKESILSILEDHLLESISGIEWSTSHAENDFKFVTESYNRFIRNLESEDLEEISVALLILNENILTISTIGEACAFLIEGDEIQKITTSEYGRLDFHTMTEGEVSRNASIYVAPHNLQNILGNELLFEFSELSGTEFEDVASDILQRELSLSLHMIRIAHSFKNIQKEIKKRGRGQLHLLKNKSADAIKYVKEMPVWRQVKDRIDTIDFNGDSRQRYAYIVTGAIVSFLLIIFIINAITSSLGGSNDTSREQVLRAQSLIEESQKLSGNPSTFTANITEAEKILTELKTSGKYTSEVTQLQERIEVLKKEAYGIHTINIDSKTSLINLDWSAFTPNITGEFNNKITVAGKNSLIYDFVRNGNIPSILTYPHSDEIESAVISDAGIPYILTKNKRVITRRQASLVNLKVDGNEIWADSGNIIKEYNGAIYIVNTDANQIYRYRPLGGGFNKNNVLPNLTSTKILDIGIDGGFYILMADGKIGRYVSTNADAGIISMTLNQIPGEWSINPDEITEFITSEKLSYIYIRNGKKLWVFKPDTKNFKDVKSMTYMAQLDLQSDNLVTDVSVPRDGLLYFTTEKWIFEQSFNISDGKFYLN